MEHGSRTWRPSWPCPVGAVLVQQRHGGRDPSYAVTPDGAHWRAFRTPEGLGTLRVRLAAGEVAIDTWGPGAAWLLDAAPGLLGADDDISGFVPRHALVADVWRRNPTWRFSRSGLVLDALVPAVFEQKVTGQEAFGAWGRLLRRHGEDAPVPDRASAPPLRVAPAADRLAMIPSWEWLQLPVDHARSRTVVQVARAAAGLERTVARPATEAEPLLRSVPGVGVWTAAETLRRAWGDPDAVSFGDYHVAKDVGWALTGTPVDDAGLAELLEPYRPHRGRVVELLARAGLGRPRRGARMAPRRHLPGSGR
ncbi:MAG TPA: DNA-3-methyladenine glycosylase 2 family protein [Nocardioides sp.]